MKSSGTSAQSTTSAAAVKVISADPNKVVDAVRIYNGGASLGFVVINGESYPAPAQMLTLIEIPTQALPDIYIQREASADMTNCYVYATFRGV